MSNEDLIRKRIRNLREATGMSQGDLAFKLGIDERTYARLERGERKQLDLHLLSAIASAMGIDLLNLLTPVFEKQTSEKPLADAKPKPANEHYEYVISQLMEIIESQKRIIHQKSGTLQETAALDNKV